MVIKFQLLVMYRLAHWAQELTPYLRTALLDQRLSKKVQ